MDIEFIVQDVFALTRPQWKLASNLEEASRAFQLAVAQDQKTSGLDKSAEQADVESDGPSDVEMDDGEAEVDAEGDGEAGIDEAEENSESDEDAEVLVLKPHADLSLTYIYRLMPTVMSSPLHLPLTPKKNPLLSLGKRKKLIQRMKQSLSVSMLR
jgi:hypothetical protein